MMIPKLRLRPRMAAVALAALAIGIVARSVTAVAQVGDDKTLKKLDRQIANLIPTLKDIIWQDITIYTLGDDPYKRLKDRANKLDAADIKAMDETGKTIDPAEPLADFGNNGVICASNDANRKDFNKWLGCMLKKYPQVDVDELKLAGNEDQLLPWKATWGSANAIVARRKSFPKSFYLVASRDRTNPRLIALIGFETNDVNGSTTIKTLLTGMGLYTDLHTSNGNGGDTTMYNELKEAITAHESAVVSNQMINLRDFTTLIIAAQTKVRASQIDESKYAYVLTGISEGRPLRKAADTTTDSSGSGPLFPIPGDPNLFPVTNGKDKLAGAEIPNTVEYPYEIGVGTDVVASFRQYTVHDRKVPDLQWGLELRNGFDEINYPSIWGGRFTLNVLLENVKIGAVLPMLRFGDSTIALSGFSASQPQKILGGFGVAFSGDFAAPVLDNSGLFNFFATYTASVAQTDKITSRVITVTGKDTAELRAGETGYLVRYAGQGYYSFGFFIDDAARHLFRIKVGGGVYGVDSYQRQQVQTGTKLGDPMYQKTNGGQNVGGVAVKLEYMKGGQKIPYGVSVQYFDQSVLGDVWLQFIANPALDFKVEAKFSAPILRELHPWENSSIFAPSIGVKYHFGD